MSQCLRCGKPCETSSVFCEVCRTDLRSQLWQATNTIPEASIVAPPVVAMTPEGREVSGDPLERITGPQPIVRASQLPQTPQPPAISSAGIYSNGDVVEQAVHRLNEAAQRIAQVEHGARRVPRASRLAPMRDISADIQRHSTPLPRVPSTTESEKSEDLGRRVPDLWPWLQEAEVDESEHDLWSNGTDPLMARHLPNSAEVARIEEEDLRRAMAEGLVTVPILPRRTAATGRRLRLAFVAFAILAIAFLVVDSVLLAVVFTHPHHAVPVLNGPPSLTLSSNVATIGQTVVLHVRHFSSDARVFLTHDIQEPVQVTNGSPLINLSADGSADVTMLIDANWGPGYHALQAEGVSTRYTASATLQITGAGPTRPSHLLIDTSSLDLGADVQGTSTIQTLTMHNSGDGSISWAASSNQSWLLLSPPQGVFSSSQTISVAVERANLKAGDYAGMITFSSNVGANQGVQVHMTVRPLPPNVGPVLEVIPPVLSFTALDGGTNPASQSIMVNNPGSQALYWSLAGNSPVNVSSQSLLLNRMDLKPGWLSTDQVSGVVVAHGTSVIHVLVNSRNLLPGVYTSVLTFAGSHAYDGSQSVSVSLTIEPRCGLTLNAGIMSFTAVSGQSNPSNQTLGLSATSSCVDAINWKAISASSWLTVSPAAGQLKGSASTVTSVGVNATILKPGNYTGYISFLSGQNTQTVTVQLAVQAAPPPSAPILGATPLNLNFSTTQGMPNPPGQVVTITNTGASRLNWHTTVNILSSSWLGAGPTGGSIAAGQMGQVTVYINTAGLTPNTYVGQVVLIGTDTQGHTASGSPQTITVNLLVLPPCTLQQPSLSSVAFTATQGSSDPSPQSVVITASGNCAWPLSWQATAANSPTWLKLSPTSGSLAASGQSASITVAASIAGLTANTYTTQVTITASDGSNTAVQGSPQAFTVTLTVLPPCSLQLTTNNLGFSLGQGQPAPAPQSFSFSESGTCARPVSWSVTGDAGSSSWLVLGPPTSGSDSGTVSVGVNPQGLAIGSYTGTITLSAVGNGGAVVQGSPQTISVTVTISGYTLSGTVIACSDSTCTSTKALPGAALTLVNSTTNQTLTFAADSLGNFSFTGLALGAYTLTATGSDGTYNYSGTVTLNVSGNQSNFVVDVYPK